MSDITAGLDRAQAQYDAQTPPYDEVSLEDDGREIWNEDAPCACEIDDDEGIAYYVTDDCRRHSEPPCDRCGWQAVCPDCVGT